MVHFNYLGEMYGKQKIWFTWHPQTVLTIGSYPHHRSTLMFLVIHLQNISEMSLFDGISYISS